MGIAMGMLAACWAAWLYPFVFRARRVAGRRAAATDRRGTWGLAAEAAAVALAAFGPRAAPGALRIAAALLFAAAGAALAWWAVGHLGRQWRIQAGVWPDHRLVTTGPYALVRHPIFTSGFLMLLATGLLRAAWPTLLAAVALYAAGTEFRLRVEERLLAARFGAEFDRYRRRVRAWLPLVR